MHETLYKLLLDMADVAKRAQAAAESLEDKVRFQRLNTRYRELWRQAKLEHFEYEDAAAIAAK